MKYIETTISSISAFLILICSVIQFHHHDIDGKMTIFTNGVHHVCDNVNKLNHKHSNKHEVQNPNYNCSCNDTHNHDENNCSLKISIVKYEKKYLEKIFIAYFTIIDFISDINNFSITIPINKYVPNLSLRQIPTLGLRAPPAL